MTANRLFSGPAEQGAMGTMGTMGHEPIQILQRHSKIFFPQKTFFEEKKILDLPSTLLLRITTIKSGELMRTFLK